MGVICCPEITRGATEAMSRGMTVPVRWPTRSRMKKDPSGLRETVLVRRPCRFRITRSFDGLVSTAPTRCPSQSRTINRPRKSVSMVPVRPRCSHERHNGRLRPPQRSRFAGCPRPRWRYPPRLEPGSQGCQAEVPRRSRDPPTSGRGSVAGPEPEQLADDFVDRRQRREPAPRQEPYVGPLGLPPLAVAPRVPADPVAERRQR